MSDLIKIRDLDLNGKLVLIREDYNVPLVDGEVSDDTRIQASIPTINQVKKAGAKIILFSHLGRPEEGVYEDKFSLAPVAKRLSSLLGKEVPLIKNWLEGIDMNNHEIVLCENVRFEIGEKSNDDELARKMASLSNVFINDAFATAHRAQASTFGVAKYAPVSCAGPLLISELKALTRAFRDPAIPLIAIVGGAKVSTKLMVLETLIEKVDQLIVGGGIANTFLKAAGYKIGNSLFEAELVKDAEKLLKHAQKAGKEIPLPSDVVCAKEFTEDASAIQRSTEAVEDDDLILDVGPVTANHYAELIKQAGTIVWNGPLGVFEYDQFGKGTEKLARAIAESDAYSVAGGGDTIAAISKYKIKDQISYISTGGGAFLEFLEGKKLPAISILEESARAWSSMERAREF